MPETQDYPDITANQIKKVLIIKWSALGDCVLASSVFKNIRDCFPEAELHLNVAPPWHHLFQHDPNIDQLIAFPIRKSGIQAYFKWLAMIKKGKYDLIIDLQSNDKTCFLLSLAKFLRFGGRIQAGMRPSFAFNYFAPKQAENLHISERFRCLFSQINIPLEQDLTPHLYASTEEIINVQNLTQDLGRFILFFPGCSPKAKNKQWPSHYYIQLATLIKTHHLADHIILIGAKDEVNICQTIANSDTDKTPFIINLCEKTSLLELSQWSKHAIASVGNDTGTSHIASCSKKLQITLFGPTSHIKSSPLNANNINLYTEINCRPCFNNHCKLQHLNCLKEITPEQVFQTLQKHLKQTVLQESKEPLQ